jgi:hypothetical protein
MGRIEQIFNCNKGDNYKSEMMLINFVLDQNVELYFYSARLLAHWNNRPHFAQSGHIYPILNHRVSLLTPYMVIREARNTGTCIYTIFELTQPINDRPRQVCQPQPHIFGLSGGNKDLLFQHNNYEICNAVVFYFIILIKLLFCFPIISRCCVTIKIRFLI